MITPLPPSVISTTKINRTNVGSVSKYRASPPHTPATFRSVADSVSRRWVRSGVVTGFSVVGGPGPCIPTSPAASAPVVTGHRPGARRIIGVHERVRAEPRRADLMNAHRMAAYVEQRGPAESIRLGELPVPDLGPDDVLVAVTAVSVNPVDTYVRSGRYDTPIPLPFIVGRDLVGTVAAVGSAVRDLTEGDAVWANSLGHAGRQGVATDLAVVARERLYRLPDGVDPELAVAVAHPAVTAYLGWFGRAAIRPGR